MATCSYYGEPGALHRIILDNHSRREAAISKVRAAGAGLSEIIERGQAHVEFIQTALAGHREFIQKGRHRLNTWPP